MKINGYELNVSEDFLDDIFAHKTRTIELVLSLIHISEPTRH